MKKAEYYESMLTDLKKEKTRESRVLNGLDEILTYLRGKKYKPLDSLEVTISELEARRTGVKSAVKRIEEIIK
jgi:hypothetical protein